MIPEEIMFGEVFSIRYDYFSYGLYESRTHCYGGDDNLGNGIEDSLGS